MSRPGRRRRVVRSTRFQREQQELLAEVPRREEALAGYEEVVSRAPDLGMTVAGRPDCCGRPIHTDQGSFLIVYTFDEEEVVLLTIRRVPSGRF